MATKTETTKRIAPGIVKVQRAGVFVGYRASVRVPDRLWPHGRLRAKRFPKDATLTAIQAWRAKAREIATLTPTTAPPEDHRTGFAADARRYLDAVQALPTIAERRRHIQAWTLLFGTRARSAITPLDIRLQRDRWLTVGPKMVLVKRAGQPARWEARPIPLSPQSVTLRLRALENLWTVLDGPHAPNPVREVDEPDGPDLIPRGQSFALGYEILACMPDRTTPKKGGTHERGSLSRIRFEAMLVTGLPAKQLGMLQPEHVNWETPSLLPPKRLKGRRSRRKRAHRTPTPRQLMPMAVPVLRQFFALGANRRFHSSSLRRSVLRAIRAANQIRATAQQPPIPETVRLYDLTRHTFGTEVYRLTKDILAVKALMGHADVAQSERYALAAIQEQQVAATSALSEVARTAKVSR